MSNSDALTRIEKATELPLLLLAILLIPLIALPWFVDLSSDVSQSLLVADWIIWAIFAAVFIAKLAVAPRKLAFLRANWIELAVVLLPFLRPIRVLRVLRLARVASALGFNVKVVRHLTEQRGVKFASAVVILLLVAGSSAAWFAERGEEGANITSWGDSLWWATTTMTTVGYGDAFPVTPLGRGIAVVLMLVGIGMVSVLTATVAAYIVRDDEGPQMKDIMLKLEEIERRLDALSKPE